MMGRTEPEYDFSLIIADVENYETACKFVGHCIGNREHCQIACYRFVHQSPMAVNVTGWP